MNGMVIIFFFSTQKSKYITLQYMPYKITKQYLLNLSYLNFSILLLFSLRPYSEALNLI